MLGVSHSPILCSPETFPAPVADDKLRSVLLTLHHWIKK